MKFKNFFFSRGTGIATLVAILFSSLIFWIYFSGYHGMPNNTNKLPITIVNQDSKSHALQHQIKASLQDNFDTIKTTANLKKAKQQLNRRETYLVIDIPANFSRQVQANQKAQLHFYINEANQTSVVSGMRTVARTVGNNIQQKVIIKKGQAILAASAVKKLNQQVATAKAQLQAQVDQAETPQMAKQIAQTGQAKIAQTAKVGQAKINQSVSQAYQGVANGVQIKMHYTNPVKEGLNYSLAPFFANLALYLGSMLGATILYGTYAKFAPTIGRWRAFLALQLTFAIIVIIIGGLYTGYLRLMLGGIKGTAINLWLNAGLLLFAGYDLNLVMLLLFGQAGTIVNIFFTMLQVVACAGMLPVVTLNTFFQAIHYLSPMFYATSLNFNLFYGGAGMANLFSQFTILILGLIILNTFIVSFRKRQFLLDMNKLI